MGGPVKPGVRIGFASGDWGLGALDADGNPTLGGAGHYRMGIPAGYLSRHGVDTVLGTLIRSGISGEFGVMTWDRAHHWGCDVVVMQRWMQRGLGDEIRKARALGQVIVQDVDDAFWDIDPRNKAFVATHPRTNPDENIDHYRDALAASDAITVSTPALEQSLRFKGVETVLVRNAIDLERWVPHDVARTPVTVGWVGSQPWRSGDLETLRGAISPIIKARGWSFHHSGHAPGCTPASTLIGLPTSTPQTMIPLVGIVDYPRVFAPIDIGLVPLADRKFNTSKSAIKGIEYAASGVPFVASSCSPEYRWLYETHGIGRVATGRKGWMPHLDALADPELRTSEGRIGRERVATFDAAVRWTDWESVYVALLDR